MITFLEHLPFRPSAYKQIKHWFREVENGGHLIMCKRYAGIDRYFILSLQKKEIVLIIVNRACGVLERKGSRYQLHMTVSYLK